MSLEHKRDHDKEFEKQNTDEIMTPGRPDRHSDGAPAMVRLDRADESGEGHKQFPSPSEQRKIHLMQRSFGNLATLRHFGYGKNSGEMLQAKTRTDDEVSDPHERDADWAADGVVGQLHGGSESMSDVAEELSPASSPAIALKEETESPAEENAAPVEESAAPVEESPASVEESTVEPEVSPAERPGGLIVEDEATEIGDGQMKKFEFIDKAEAAVDSVLDEVMGVTAYMAARVGLAAQVFSYRSKSAGAIEKEIRQKLSGASGQSTAADYIPLIAVEVRKEAIAGQEAETAETAESVQSKGRGGKPGSKADPVSVKGELGSGQKLDGPVRSKMEQAFGADFSQVSVHTDGKAAELSDGMNARAFTVGRDIGFANSEYKPGTMAGDALIAHELAHTIQQQGATKGSPQSKGEQNGALEADADTSAIGAMAGLISGAAGSLAGLAAKAGPRFKSGLQLSRCKKEPKTADQVLPEEFLLDEATGSGSSNMSNSLGEMHGQDIFIQKGALVKDIQAHLTAMNAGGVYVFYGHGGYQGGSAKAVQGADNESLMADGISEALAADGNPPTLVVLSGCGTASLLDAVQKGGVPVAAGIGAYLEGLGDTSANIQAASAMVAFLRELNAGKTFAEAEAAGNVIGARRVAGPFDPSTSGRISLKVVYGEGYNSGMTLEDARRKHRGR